MPESNSTLSQELMAQLEKDLPPFFLRADIGKLTWGIITPRAMEAHDAHGTGPEIHRAGRRVVYRKNEFLAWMRDYYGGMYVTESFSKFGRRVRCRSAGAQDTAGTDGCAGGPGDGAAAQHPDYDGVGGH